MPVLQTAGGAAIGWDDFGDADAPPLILVQGFSAQRLGWRPGFCQRVADEGFRVIRFDNRDVGQSQRYPVGGYGMVDFADDTAALLDGLAIDAAHIVGQSMGGIIAQELVLRHPQRVRSLGLMYTAATANHFVGRDAIEGRMSDALPTTREEFERYYPASEAGCASTAYPQDVAWLARVAGEIWDNGWDPAGIERQLAALLQWTGTLDAMRDVTAPTTILAGDADQLIDFAASLELHGAMPTSTLTIFPGMGHEVPEPLWGEIAGLLATNASRAEVH
jgi:pimeloyl-ACP methyl ester carboxylesterase